MNRADYLSIAPDLMAILFKQEAYFNTEFSTSDMLTVKHWELVKMRVSQINQCAYCIDMHSKQALSYGESAERLFGLSAWRDMPLYSASERLALEWAEVQTHCQPIDDALYQRAVNAFGEKGVVDLVVAVNAINSWNRIVKAFKPEIGVFNVK